MPGLASLAGRDFDRILSFVREAATTDDDEPFSLATIDRLARLVPADQVGYYEYDIRPNHARTGAYNNGWPLKFEVKQPGPDVPWTDDIQATWWHWPLNDVDNRHRVKARRFSASLPTRAERRRSAWRALVMRPSGIADELDVWLPAPAGTVRAFFFVRGTSRHSFSDRDEMVLTLLRPQLEAIRQRWERRHRPSELTRREAELLELVRAGLTNREIAARLVISPATVRVHLSNLFGKLGVHTRTAAATINFDSDGSSAQLGRTSNITPETHARPAPCTHSSTAKGGHRTAILGPPSDAVSEPDASEIASANVAPVPFSSAHQS